MSKYILAHCHYILIAICMSYCFLSLWDVCPLLGLLWPLDVDDDVMGFAPTETVLVLLPGTLLPRCEVCCGLCEECPEDGEVCFIFPIEEPEWLFMFPLPVTGPSVDVLCAFPFIFFEGERVLCFFVGEVIRTWVSGGSFNVWLSSSMRGSRLCAEVLSDAISDSSVLIRSSASNVLCWVWPCTVRNTYHEVRNYHINGQRPESVYAIHTETNIERYNWLVYMYHIIAVHIGHVCNASRRR